MIDAAHMRAMRYMALRLVGPQDADDLVQTTALRVVKTTVRPDPISNAWLGVVLHREHYKRLRDAKQTRKRGAPETCIDLVPQRYLVTQPAQLYAVELSETIAALGRLPRYLRDTITCRVLGDEAIEIAAARGVDRTTIARWCAEARRAIAAERGIPQW